MMSTVQRRPTKKVDDHHYPTECLVSLFALLLLHFLSVAVFPILSEIMRQLDQSWQNVQLPTVQKNLEMWVERSGVMKVIVMTSMTNIAACSSCSILSLVMRIIGKTAQKVVGNATIKRNKPQNERNFHR